MIIKINFAKFVLILNAVLEKNNSNYFVQNVYKKINLINMLITNIKLLVLNNYY